MRSPCVLIALMMLFALAGETEAAAATFPGPQRELPSPDSAYAVMWWEPDAGSANHSLLLRAPHTPKTWRVHSFA